MLIGAAGLVTASTGHAQENSLFNPNDGKVVSSGIKVYQEHCVSCHGAKLEGEPNWRTRKKSDRMPAPPHSEKGHTWHHADQLLFELTKFGLKKLAGDSYETDMPAYENV